MRDIDFIIPSYNEELNIEPLAKDIINCFDGNGIKNFRIIFIENGSSDSSIDIIKKLNHLDKRITSLILSRNFGPQGAIHAGLVSSKSKYVCILDGDQQDPPIDALNMYKKAVEEELDVVYAVRRSRKESIIRKIGFKIFYKVWSSLSTIKVPKDAGEFSVIKRNVVDVILSMQEIHRFNRGLRAWAGFKQKGYFHDRPIRTLGEQKFNFLKDIFFGIDAVISFSLFPLRVVLFLGIFIFFLCMAIFLINFIAILLKWNDIIWLFNMLPKGITSINLIIIFLQAILFISLGIIGEYIGKNFEQLKNRPTFIIKDKIE